ncbi:hypothetical protein COOONC_23336 [Cooperia oncophora]
MKPVPTNMNAITSLIALLVINSRKLQKNHIGPMRNGWISSSSRLPKMHLPRVMPKAPCHCTRMSLESDTNGIVCQKVRVQKVLCCKPSSGLENTVGLGRDEQEDFETCHYWIESPEGTEIEVKLVNFTKGLSVDGCSYAGVEIKTNKDQTLTGYRCRSLVPSGFCKGTLSEATKKKVCPKSCGFCDSLH